MAFTIHRADATDHLLIGELGTTPVNTDTIVYDETGATPLLLLAADQYQYFTAPGTSWQNQLHSSNDTLITGSTNDFIVWDSGTTAGASFSGAARARLDTSDPDGLIRIFDLGDGADIVNLTHSAGAGTPGAYSISTTVYGGNGIDRLALGAGADFVQGGEGKDVLWGGAGDDLLWGDTGTDAPANDEGPDTIYGGGGNDAVHGEGDDDQISGDAGNDTLYGGAGLDEIFGGMGSDVIVADADAMAVAGDYVVGWEGGDQAQPHTIALSAGDQIVLDYIDGGVTFDENFNELDTDTLVLDMLPGGPNGRNVLTLSANGGFSPHIVGIEVVAASAGADVVNLSWYVGGGGFGYEGNVTVLAGDGADVVFAGDGRDLIIGDATGGMAGFADTLFGGRGEDTIFGDGAADGPGGADTIYGGFGNDTVYGGAGDDRLFDSADGSHFGGLGSDILVLRYSDSGATGRADGGPDDTADGTDGNDFVFISGVYDLVESQLGTGDDIFISTVVDENTEAGSGDRTDRVFGGEGNDIISTWYGNDELQGGDGNDALWGGDSQSPSDDQPGDTLYGGPGTDFLYPGDGNNDLLFGGAGVDYYYWARIDGMGDQVYDEFRDTDDPGQAENTLIVFAGYDENAVMLPGTGVFEADGDITDTIDGDEMVYAYDLDGDDPGTVWRLEIFDGEGAGNYIDFDQRDINRIILWNHDATGTTPVQTIYTWNGATYDDGIP